MQVNKELIRRRFASAIDSYDAEALPQREIAVALCEMLTQEEYDKIRSVLEIGCGTGFLTCRLRHKLPQDVNMTLLDICPEVEPALREKVGDGPRLIVADAECMHWEGRYDLIASSSCIQWWSDPSAFFSKSAEHSTPCGKLLFGTFGPENMHELRTLMGYGLTYHSIDDVAEQVRRGGWKLKEIRQIHKTIRRDSLYAILRHIKQTGVNALAQTTSRKLTIGQMEKIENKYRETFANAAGELPLTYHGIIGMAEKK